MKILAFVIALLISSSAGAEILRLEKISPDLFRGGQPESPADYAFLRKQGIKTIISFRKTDYFNDQDQHYASLMGMRALHFPMPGALFKPSKRSVRAALRALLDPALQPVFIHCKHGRDRTGMMTALYRVFGLGWSPDSAYEAWEKSDFVVNLFTQSYVDRFWDIVADGEPKIPPPSPPASPPGNQSLPATAKRRAPL